MSERASGAASRLHLGACVLDLQARELRTYDDRPVQLRPKALGVLLLLAERAGQVLDKQTLMERIWPGVVVGDDSLTQTVVEIRRAIGDRERRMLCTVARRGYRLQPSDASASAAAPALSVAVLPIAPNDTEPDSVRLAAVLTGELTSKAGVGLSDSKVLARETVAAAGPALTDPCLAAARLRVQQVVCGELQAIPNGWTLALAVVDGASGARRWSHRFVLTHPGLPEQIRRVTAQAARAVFVEMHRMAAEMAAVRPPSARSAGDLALQGWASIYDGISPGNLERAQQFFEQAVARDPSHRRGLGGIAITNHWLLLTGWASDRQQAQRRVLNAAARLEELYPNDTLTALSSSSAADVGKRWDLLLSIGDRLCESDPDSPTSHCERALGLLKLGRFDECLGEIGHALDLSVDDFRAGWWHSIAACAHLMIDHHGPAAIAARQATAANACLSLPPLLLAAALAGDRRLDESREVLRQHRAREPHSDRSHVVALLGDGDSEYERACARVLATLESLGLPGS